MIKNDLNIPHPDQARVVVVGGGFAGINFIKQLKNADLQVVLIDKNNFHTFQPLLYQVAISGLEPSSIAKPFRKIFNSFPNVHFRKAEVLRIEIGKNLIITSAGELTYDYLVLANGTVSNYFNNENVERHAFPLKEMSDALNLRNRLLEQFEKASLTSDGDIRQQLLTYAIVGAGPTGVEVAGALAEIRDQILQKDYKNLSPEMVNIHLIEANDKVLPQMTSMAGQKAGKYLERMGVKISLNKMVEHYDGTTLKFSHGKSLKAGTLIWGAGVKGNLIEGLDRDFIRSHQIVVDEVNRVKGHQNIYAIGDIALLENDDFPQGHPGVAQVAIQQGKNLGKNILRDLRHQSWKPFKYIDKGTMATIGRNQAVADLSDKLNVGGMAAWLLWGLIHIYYLIGFRNKFITMFNWIVNYITYDKGTKMISWPYTPRKSTQSEDTSAKDPDMPELKNHHQTNNIQNDYDQNRNHRKMEVG